MIKYCTDQSFIYCGQIDALMKRQQSMTKLTIKAKKIVIRKDDDLQRRNENSVRSVGGQKARSSRFRNEVEIVTHA